jgi:hypothetical protein
MHFSAFSPQSYNIFLRKHNVWKEKFRKRLQQSQKKAGNTIGIACFVV